MKKLIQTAYTILTEANNDVPYELAKAVATVLANSKFTEKYYLSLMDSDKVRKLSGIMTGRLPKALGSYNKAGL